MQADSSGYAQAVAAVGAALVTGIVAVATQWVSANTQLTAIRGDRYAQLEAAMLEVRRTRIEQAVEEIAGLVGLTNAASRDATINPFLHADTARVDTLAWLIETYAPDAQAAGGRFVNALSALSKFLRDEANSGARDRGAYVRHSSTFMEADVALRAALRASLHAQEKGLLEHVRREAKRP